MADAFPIVKLATLAFKQVAKPIVNVIKNRAKRKPFFRKYVCMPPAQAYHWMEVNVKMKMLGLGKPSKVQKLNESMAIELGAELLGETILFGVGALAVTAEYMRQSRKASAEELAIDQKWNKLENRIQDLMILVDKQSVEVRDLTRISYALQSSLN